MTSEISENTIFVRFNFPQFYLMITMSLSPSKESAAMLMSLREPQRDNREPLQ